MGTKGKLGKGVTRTRWKETSWISPRLDPDRIYRRCEESRLGIQGQRCSAVSGRQMVLNGGFRLDEGAEKVISRTANEMGGADGTNHVARLLPFR